MCLQLETRDERRNSRAGFWCRRSVGRPACLEVCGYEVGAVFVVGDAGEDGEDIAVYSDEESASFAHGLQSQDISLERLGESAVWCSAQTYVL